MEFNLKFVIDDYDWYAAHIKKSVTINRRNKDEVIKGYLDTVYIWSIRRYIGPDEYTGFDFRPSAASQITGSLQSSNVLDKLNSDYCFDFDYEPLEKDKLFVRYQYKNPELTRKPRPRIISEHLLYIYNGNHWEEQSYIFGRYEELSRGILYITPK